MNEYERKGITEALKAYILISKILAITALLLMGFHIINQLDDVMSSQRMQDKTITDAMDQIMWLRQEIDELKEDKPPEIISLGGYTISHYCACSRCCGESEGTTATGTVATEGRTIAVDPNVIPYGTKVLIDGHEYVAEDCGGAIKGKKIDIFVPDHQEALNRGRITREVFIYDE